MLTANENAYQTLAAMLSGGRLSHAILIEGPAGCGKMTFARELAQAVLCRADTRPCGVCRDCVKAEKDIHPDILTYGGDGGSRSFHVDTVRALRQQAFVRPNEADGKAFILRGVHEMSAQAQNALLKIIEEPPSGVTFILTCENRSAMLETVLSRVQVIALSVPSDGQCAEVLAGRLPDTEPDKLLDAARRSNGNVGLALALLEKGGEEDTLAGDILYGACIGDELEALAALAKYERDRQGLADTLERMEAALAAALARESGDERLRELVKRAGRLRLLKIIDIIDQARQSTAFNAGGPLLTTGLCAKIRATLAE